MVKSAVIAAKFRARGFVAYAPSDWVPRWVKDSGVRIEFSHGHAWVPELAWDLIMEGCLTRDIRKALLRRLAAGAVEQAEAAAAMLRLGAGISDMERFLGWTS